jgi:universal stress protein E
MDKLQSIVVGVDFTACSGVALRQAIRIAQWNRATVRAVHVIDTLVATELEEALSPFQKDVRAQLVTDAQRAWGRFTQTVPGSESVPLDVLIDHRTTGILARARAAQADLLVLGAFGENPDVGVGTVATACVRSAASPVLLVRENQPGAFKTVVACVDFSPTSLHAVAKAARIAAQDGAALHILHVYTAPWNALHYRSPTPEADPNFRHQYTDGLRRRLEGFCEPLKHELTYLKPAIELFEYTRHGAGIVQYAQDAHADLVVLGTRGRTNIRDLLLGSTAERVLRQCTCSLLAIRPQAD